MNQTTNAGLDLDATAKLDQLLTLWSEAAESGVTSHEAIRDLIVAHILARRAEPSVTEADERALPPLPKSVDRVAIHVRICNDVPKYTKEGSAESWEDYYTADQMKDYARAALASPAVPEGYKLVPIEPTPEMIDNIAAFVDGHDNDAEVIYRAMVAAAPAVSQKDGAAVDMTADEARAALQSMPLETVVGMVQGAATTASASDEELLKRFSDEYGPASARELAAILKDRATAPSRDAIEQCMEIAHRWAQAAYCKALNRPGEDIDGIKRELRAALARAPLPAQEAKKCQYPNCGCTSRATCNFNYDAAPAQAPLPAKWGGREAAAKWLMNNYQDYVNISELCKAMVAAAPEQAGDALNALLTRIDDAFEIYERHGAICEFEGYPMIYADTLTEIVTLRGEYHAAMSASQDQGDAA